MFDTHHLPRGVQLIYASSDAGKENVLKRRYRQLTLRPPNLIRSKMFVVKPALTL